MKMIGLLGGTSWPSTFSYYEKLNREVQRSMGGFHSARILLYSIDYHAIKSLYHDGWDQIPALLRQEIQFFLEKKPDGIIICNNTLHRAYDQIQEDLKISVPVFHAGHLTAEETRKRRYKTVLLLGTLFTMEDGFFAKYFSDRNIDVVVPRYEDRKIIQEIQSNLAQGRIESEYASRFVSLLNQYPHVEAIVPACTELPLILNEKNSPKPLINPIDCQCQAAIRFALGSEP